MWITAERLRINDVVVLVPGITGSVLEKDGRPVWDARIGLIWKGLTSRGRSLDPLLLKNDDPEADHLGDGIRATGLIKELHGIPGLSKGLGYHGISRFLTETFTLTPGAVDGADDAANYFEFPYDWRRDNRAAALQLKRLVDRQLDLRKKRYPDARAILLAHSMGGLVCRHYLELLGGWERCRALISFGTPYRGSSQALDYLVNGYKKLFVDVTEIVRSFTSAYQLLPRYRVVDVGGNDYRKPKDLDVDPIPGFRGRANDGYGFHTAIDDAIEKRGQGDAFVVLPFVGTRQETAQSAVLEDGKLRVLDELPSWIDPQHDGGDGTVPLVSAIPIELSNQHVDTFAPGRHSALLDARETHQNLRHRLIRLLAKDLAAVRAAPVSVEDEAAEPALSLHLEDVSREDEPVDIAVDLEGMAQDPLAVECTIHAPNGEQPLTVEMTRVDEERWHVAIPHLDAGDYVAEVRTRAPGPRPVTDLFWVTR